MSDELRVFISYSHSDGKAVGTDRENLEQAGLDVWLDQRIPGGIDWSEEIASAITAADVFLIYLSPSSVASEHCRRELTFAITREKPVLSVYLEPTHLSQGFEMNLGNRQGLVRYDQPRASFVQRLVETIKNAPHERSLLPTVAGQRVTPDASLAILPLANLGLSDDDLICDGLAEDMINGLSAVRSLKVAPRTSSFVFRDTDSKRSTSAIANSLNVRYVLEGSWRRSGNRVRVNLRLVDCKDGFPAWSEQYTREIVDIFDLQDEIASKVITSLRGHLAHSTTSPDIVGTRNIEAYKSYLQGLQEFRNWDIADSGASAQIHFERAIELDPDFFDAVLHLALSTFEDKQHRAELFDRAMALATTERSQIMCEALRLTDRHMYDHLATEAAWFELLKRWPTSRELLHSYGCPLCFMALPVTARAYFVAGIEQEMSADGYYWIGVTYLCTSEYDQAAEWFERSLAYQPNTLAQTARVLLHGVAGNRKKARQALEEFTRNHTEEHPFWPALRANVAYWDDDMDAIDHLLQARRLPNMDLALVYFMRGRLVDGVEVLINMANAGNYIVMWHLYNHHYLPGLRAKLLQLPRYRQLMEQIAPDPVRAEFRNRVRRTASCTGIELLD
ncbi:MAG: TIR domain-containing protein [Pseudomonadales bacterium]